MAYWNSGQVRSVLKNGVDMQLQTAFNDNNWPTVARLADQRVRLAHTPGAVPDSINYYSVVKAVAESKQEAVTATTSLHVAIDGWVRKSPTMTAADVEAFDLMEWAAADLCPMDYASTIGILRTRWAKANPRNTKGAMTCLEKCVLRWDIINAQQIAAILEKAISTSTAKDKDTRPFFWNVLLTHMLSESDSISSTKRTIYGMLAQKQLEKAAADGRLTSEEELLLFWRVLSVHGTPETYKQQIMNADNGVVAQFRRGRKQLLYESLAHLEKTRQFDIIFSVCKDVLSGENANTACDVRVWNAMIEAAKQQSNVGAAFDDILALLQKFITAKSALPSLNAKNVSLALVRTVAQMPASLTPRFPGSTAPVVDQLLDFINAYVDRPSLFGDIKKTFEELPFDDAEAILAQLRERQDGADHWFVLEQKLTYLLLTCSQSRCARAMLDGAVTGDELTEIACKLCKKAAPDAFGCKRCLENSVKRCLDQFTHLKADLTDKGKELCTDLALVAASSLLRLSGIHRQSQSPPPGFPWTHGIDTVRLFQAIYVLGARHLTAPDNIPVRLLLIRALLAVGAVSHALSLWEALGVKRTILNALAPLAFDRLSTVAPATFAARDPATLAIQSYFRNVLKDPSPVKVWDAFLSASYSSIFGMEKFHRDIEKSCTHVMASVEHRRTQRMYGGRPTDVTHPTVTALFERPPDILLHNATDYGSIPNFEASPTILGEAVAIGPPLSSRRMQLGLLAERFIDHITYKPPKEYKPSKAADAAYRERVFLQESFTILHSSFDALLHSREARAEVTPAEWVYSTVLASLSAFMSFALSGASTNMLPLLGNTIKGAVETAKSSIVSPTPIDAMLNLHTVGMLRETAMAVKQTSAFVMSFQDREMTRDRTGKSGLPKEALAEAKMLRTLATETLVLVKSRVRLTSDGVDSLGPDALASAFGAGDDSLSDSISRAFGPVMAFAGVLKTDWAATMSGWAQVQFD